MKPYKVQLYREGTAVARSEDGVLVCDFTGYEYRWRVTHPNGQVVAASTEGYTRRHAAVLNLSRLFGDRLLLDTSKRGDLVGTLDPA